nr:hypothetical protein [Microcystis aeruginosa K13-05]
HTPHPTPHTLPPRKTFSADPKSAEYTVSLRIPRRQQKNDYFLAISIVDVKSGK